MPYFVVIADPFTYSTWVLGLLGTTAGCIMVA